MCTILIIFLLDIRPAVTLVRYFQCNEFCRVKFIPRL